MDQQRAHIGIASLGDRPQPDLAAGSTLPWNQSEKRGELTARLERFCVANRRDQRSCSELADARYFSDCLACRFLLVPAVDLLLKLIDILFDPVDASQLVLQTVDHDSRQGILEFLHACADLIEAGDAPGAE